MLVPPKSVPITGAARDGGELRVRPAALTWGRKPDRVIVQWKRDGVAIPGATSARLTLDATAVGHRYRARVTAVLGGVRAAARTPDVLVQPGATSERRLLARLATLQKQLRGRYTVRVAELDGGRRSVDVGGTMSREPASTVKVFIAYGVLTQVDQGRLKLTDRLASGTTVGACLRAMIEPSDNDCAVDLRLRIGTVWLDRLLAEKGYTGTRFWYSGSRTKVSTARDTTVLLARLARGTLLSESSNAHLLHLLETQIYRAAIPVGLPAAVRQASKPGALWVPTGRVQSDAAIVWGPRSRYVLTVYGSHGASMGEITRISAAVYRELQGPAGRTFRYELEQMSASKPLIMTAAVSRGSAVIGRYAVGARVEVVDSLRTRYLVRVAGRLGWVDNTRLVLRQPTADRPGTDDGDRAG